MSEKIWAGLIGGWIAMAVAIQAATLHVPGQYPTIQAGINAAVNGDTVLVADGTYTGTGNKDIDFIGKAIVVISENGPYNCTIDCQNDGRGFYFHSGEDSSSVLAGFTITNGRVEAGGGILCENTSPMMQNCIIYRNSCEGDALGGGIYCFNSHPVILDCTIRDNSAHSYDFYGMGGGIYLDHSNPVVSNCTIVGNSCSSIKFDYGGGICSFFSNPIITDCTISGNTTGGGGGGIAFRFSSATMSNCYISGNSAASGGALSCEDESSVISRCVLIGNSAVVGGGIHLFSSDATITHCTISENTGSVWGGGIYCYWNSNPRIVNTIVAGNFGEGGVYFYYSPGANILYGNFYNNEGGNFTGQAPPGLGQIVTVNTNGDSCDVFYNIFADPLFEDPAGGNFQITWANYPIPDSTRSPCIDAGDPNTPLDPDGTIADMGALYFHQGIPVAITLIPYNPPIVIPPSGDAFAYNIEIANNGNTPETFDVWVNIEVPGGYQFTVVRPVYDLTLMAGSSVERDRTVFVPGSAPAGEYSCLGMIGTYPWTVIASDAFSFTKEGAEGIWEGSEVWICTGELFPGEGSGEGKTPALPSTFALLQPFPNPFNPMTTVRFTLPEASYITLTIYDLQGRRVADLVDGLRDAGMHEISWDASNFSSGLYFCRIQAGDYSAVRKMMLMK